MRSLWSGPSPPAAQACSWIANRSRRSKRQKSRWSTTRNWPRRQSLTKLLVMRQPGATLGIGRPSRARRGAPSSRAARVAGGLGLLVALAVSLSSPLAEARSAFDSGYGFERTYNAALRLIRIDLGLTVTEKDDQSGYIVFDYKAADTG